MEVSTAIGDMSQMAAKYLLEQRVFNNQFNLNGQVMNDPRFNRPVFIWSCWRAVYESYTGDFEDRVKKMIKDKVNVITKGLDILSQGIKGKTKSQDIEI